jgi:hypothetical protein
MLWYKREFIVYKTYHSSSIYSNLPTFQTDINDCQAEFTQVQAIQIRRISRIIERVQFHTCYESSAAHGRLGLRMILGEVEPQCSHML